MFANIRCSVARPPSMVTPLTPLLCSTPPCAVGWGVVYVGCVPPPSSPVVCFGLYPPPPVARWWAGLVLREQICIHVQPCGDAHGSSKWEGFPFTLVAELKLLGPFGSRPSTLPLRLLWQAMAALFKSCCAGRRSPKRRTARTRAGRESSESFASMEKPPAWPSMCSKSRVKAKEQKEKMMTKEEREKLGPLGLKA